MNPAGEESCQLITERQDGQSHFQVNGEVTQKDNAQSLASSKEGSQKCHVANGSESGYCTDTSSPSPAGPFLDATTMQPASAKTLNSARVREFLLHVKVQLPLLDELMAELQKNHSPENEAELIKMVKVKFVPSLKQNKRFADLAKLLPLTGFRQGLQAFVITCLESLLLDLRQSQDPGVRGEVLEAVTSVQCALLQASEDSPNLLTLTWLHLMAVAALLSRCPVTSGQQAVALGISRKLVKKQSGEGLKYSLLKAMQAFLEEADTAAEKVCFSQDWRNAGFSEERKSKRKVEMGRASVCELVVTAFTLVSELKSGACSGLSTLLLESLGDLLKAADKPGKSKRSQESKDLLQSFLAGCLLVLLKSTFREDEVEVGEEGRGHIRDITDLLLNVIKNANSSIKHALLRQMESLPFHGALVVRQAFQALFKGLNVPVTHLATRHMQDSLQLVDFQPDILEQPHNEKDKCDWRDIKGTMGVNVPVEGSMFISKAGCQAAASNSAALSGSRACSLDTCIERHPGCHEKDPGKRWQAGERSRRHIRNLDMLRRLSPECKHLLQLYSYQYKPFPFYITEPVQHRRLLTHLLNLRSAQTSPDMSDLVTVTLQATDALGVLCGRGIDPRDVTAYNFVVESGGDNCRCGSGVSQCSPLTCRGKVVKLADLGLAHEFRSAEGKIRRVLSQGAVPVRWVSPEGLFKGVYGEQNMVYSVGCLMYEIWTHGCQPYSSYTLSTDDLLILMLKEPGILQLAPRPCIPREIYDIIKECTKHDPKDRPSLQELQVRLRHIHSTHINRATEPDFKAAYSCRYPDISQYQKSRGHVPETGLSLRIQELLGSGRDSELYMNTKSSTWRRSPSCAVTPAELKTTDPITIQFQGERTRVDEVVSPKFAVDELPSLEGSVLEGVTCWAKHEDCSAPLPCQDGNLLHTREYPKKCVSLLTAASKGLLWHFDELKDVYEEAVSDVDFLVPLISLAKSMTSLHEKSWIIRDLKPENILIDCINGDVILAKVGRMRQLKHGSSHLLDEVFSDSWRWLAPEVLMSEEYSRESDVFLLVTLIWQVFHIADVVTRNPRASAPDFAPCANIPKDQVLSFVREGSPLPFPPRCPEWLYDDVILKGRDPDPARRPSAEDVLNVLMQHFVCGPVRTPFIEDNTSSMEACSEGFANCNEEKVRKAKRQSPSSGIRQPRRIFRCAMRRLTRVGRRTRSRATSTLEERGYNFDFSEYYTSCREQMFKKSITEKPTTEQKKRACAESVISASEQTFKKTVDDKPPTQQAACFQKLSNQGTVNTAPCLPTKPRFDKRRVSVDVPTFPSERFASRKTDHLAGLKRTKSANVSSLSAHEASKLHHHQAHAPVRDKGDGHNKHRKSHKPTTLDLSPASVLHAVKAKTAVSRNSVMQAVKDQTAVSPNSVMQAVKDQTAVSHNSGLQAVKTQTDVSPNSALQVGTTQTVVSTNSASQAVKVKTAAVVHNERGTKEITEEASRNSGMDQSCWCWQETGSRKQAPCCCQVPLDDCHYCDAASAPALCSNSMKAGQTEAEATCPESAFYAQTSPGSISCGTIMTSVGEASSLGRATIQPSCTEAMATSIGQALTSVGATYGLGGVAIQPSCTETIATSIGQTMTYAAPAITCAAGNNNFALKAENSCCHANTTSVYSSGTIMTSTKDSMSTSEKATTPAGHWIDPGRPTVDSAGSAPASGLQYESLRCPGRQLPQLSRNPYDSLVWQGQRAMAGVPRELEGSGGSLSLPDSLPCSFREEQPAHIPSRDSSSSHGCNIKLRRSSLSLAPNNIYSEPYCGESCPPAKPPVGKDAGFVDSVQPRQVMIGDSSILQEYPLEDSSDTETIYDAIKDSDEEDEFTDVNDEEGDAFGDTREKEVAVKDDDKEVYPTKNVRAHNDIKEENSRENDVHVCNLLNDTGWKERQASLNRTLSNPTQTNGEEPPECSFDCEETLVKQVQESRHNPHLYKSQSNKRKAKNDREDYDHLQIPTRKTRPKMSDPNLCSDWNRTTIGLGGPGYISNSPIPKWKTQQRENKQKSGSQTGAGDRGIYGGGTLKRTTDVRGVPPAASSSSYKVVATDDKPTKPPPQCDDSDSRTSKFFLADSVTDNAPKLSSMCNTELVHHHLEDLNGNFSQAVQERLKDKTLDRNLIKGSVSPAVQQHLRDRTRNQSLVKAVRETRAGRQRLLCESHDLIIVCDVQKVAVVEWFLKQESCRMAHQELEILDAIGHGAPLNFQKTAYKRVIQEAKKELMTLLENLTQSDV